MTGKLHMLLGLIGASMLQASPITDPYVKNLTLVGVIHVEGARAKGQSVAVLRDRITGRTRIMHKGDFVTESNLELRDLGPQQVTLARGTQIFVLRVDSNSDSSPMLSHVESTDVELVDVQNVKTVLEVSVPSVEGSETPMKVEAQAEQRRLIPDPDCTGDECQELTE